VIVHVLACDYDGTIAEAGQVAEETAAALARVRASGRKVVLVTGRMLPDLREVCPQLDAMFDAVVAENGAVLYLPDRREVRVLGGAPEPALIEALVAAEVPLDVGHSILATTQPYAQAALAAVHDTGVERTLVFNKGSLMLLPGGVTKGTGLQAALDALELSAHNTVGVGDAENDHAFLGMCEYAVAVADAIPALRERADLVTDEPSGRGVSWLVEAHLLRDLIDLVPPLPRHQLPIGERADGTLVSIPAHAINLLIVGPSGSGKSTLSGLVVERLVEAGRSFCLIDPEGDYQTLSTLEGVVVLGGHSERSLPTPDELDQLLRRTRTGVVLNLSAMSMVEKVAYGARAVSAIWAVRASHGVPHWLLIDEAHHLFPAEGATASELVRHGGDPAGLITLDAQELPRPVRSIITAVVSTDLGALESALAMVGQGVAVSLDAAGAPLERGEAALARLDGDGHPVVTRFQVGRRKLAHRRHVRKYVEGELPPERSFFFRGPASALNLRAPNLTRFCELADGVDEGTWDHHRRQGDYSRWLRDMVKDPELADEIAVLEAGPQAPAESRRAVLTAVRRRYSV